MSMQTTCGARADQGKSPEEWKVLGAVWMTAKRSGGGVAIGSQGLAATPLLDKNGANDRPPLGNVSGGRRVVE